MTQEELKQYSELQEKFTKDVFRVVGFLKEIDIDFIFVSEFKLDGKVVKIHGWEYVSNQYKKEHYRSFDSDMLTWSNEQLRKYVYEELNRLYLQSLQKVDLYKKQKDEEELIELERLKEKF